MTKPTWTENSKELLWWPGTAHTVPTKFTVSSGIWIPRTISLITAMRRLEAIWLTTSRLLTRSKYTTRTSLCLKLDKKGRAFTCLQSFAPWSVFRPKSGKTRRWWPRSVRVCFRSHRRESEVSRSSTVWLQPQKKWRNGTWTSNLNRTTSRRECSKGLKYLLIECQPKLLMMSRF